MNGYFTPVVDVTDVETVWMRVAMAMLHSLWIGAAIGVLALIVVMLLRASRRRARHNLLVAALLLVTMSPIAVFYALAPETVIRSYGALGPFAERTFEVPGRSVWTKPIKQAPAEGESNQTSPPEALKVIDEAGTVYVVPEVVTGDYATGGFAPVIREDALAARQRIVVSPKWIVMAYAVIACALLLRLAIGIAGGSRLRRTSQFVTDGAVLSALARHTQSLGMRITPAIAYCARVAVPTVVGVVRPMILLPLSAATGVTPEQLEYLVLHELAHIRRYDHIVNLLQRVIEAVMFYHPVVWLISRQIRIEREHCCDDLVVRLGGDAHHYAESLFAAATLAQGLNVRSAVPTLSATGKASHLRQRIARILGRPAPAVRLRHTGWVFAMLCAFAGIVAIAQLESNDDAITTVPTTSTRNATNPLNSQPLDSVVTSTNDNTESTEAEDTRKPNELDEEKSDGAFLRELGKGAIEILHVTGVSSRTRDDDGKPKVILTLHVSPTTKVEALGEQLKMLDFRAHEIVFEKAPMQYRYGEGASNDAVIFAFSSATPDEFAAADMSQQITQVEALLERNKLDPSKPIDEFNIEKSVNDDPAVRALTAVTSNESPDKNQSENTGTDSHTDEYIKALDIAKQAARSKALLAVLARLNDLRELYESGEVRKDNPDDLSTQLHDKDWWLRKLAIQQLVEANQPDAWRLIVPLLKDEDSRVQAAAATALGQLKEPQSIKHLVAALKETNGDGTPADDVSAASDALTQFDQSQVLPILRLAVNDEDVSVRAGAAIALSKMRSSEVTGLLFQLVRTLPYNNQRENASGPELAFHRAIGIGLNNADRSYVIQQLSSVTKDADPRVRWAALAVIFTSANWQREKESGDVNSLLLDPTVIDEVLSMTGDSDRLVRIYTAYALNKILDLAPKSPGKISDQLVAMLVDSDPRVVSEAARALEDAGWQPTNDDERLKYAAAHWKWSEVATYGNKGVPYIVQAIRAGILPMNNESLTMVAELKDPALVDALMEKASGTNGDALRVVITALGNSGDRRAAELIALHLQTTDSGIDVAARTALMKLRDPRVLGYCVQSVLDERQNYGDKLPVIEALEEMKDPRASRALVDAFWKLDRDQDENRRILEALIRRNDVKLSEEFEQRLTQRSTTTSQNSTYIAIEYLSEHPTDTTVQTLISMLTTPDGYARGFQYLAIDALAILKAESAIGPIADRFLGPDYDFATLAGALTQIGTKDAYAALRGAYLASPDTLPDQIVTQKQTEILKSLIKSENDDARRLLIELFESDQVFGDSNKLLVAYHLSTFGNAKAEEVLNVMRGVNKAPQDAAQRALDDLFGPQGSTKTVPTESKTAKPGTSPSAATGDIVPPLQFRFVVEGAEAERKQHVIVRVQDHEQTFALADESWLCERDFETFVVNRDQLTQFAGIVADLKPEAFERFKEVLHKNAGRAFMIIYGDTMVLGPVPVPIGLGDSGQMSRTLNFVAATTEQAEKVIKPSREKASAQPDADATRVPDAEQNPTESGRIIYDSARSLEPLPERILYDK